MIAYVVIGLALAFLVAMIPLFNFCAKAFLRAEEQYNEEMERIRK